MSYNGFKVGDTVTIKRIHDDCPMRHNNHHKDNGGEIAKITKIIPSFEDIEADYVHPGAFMLGGKNGLFHTTCIEKNLNHKYMRRKDE